MLTNSHENSHENHQPGKHQKPGKRQPIRPEAPQGIEDQLIRNTEGFTFKIKDDAFGAPTGDRPSLSATLADGTALPAWLSFDPILGVFSGTPPLEASTSLEVKVTASTPTTLPISDTFTLKTAKPIRRGENDAPMPGGMPKMPGEVHGTEESDICDGGSDDDVMDGGSGDDKIFGGDGNDRLMGSRGDDDMEGGIGKDILQGGEGKDSLNGGLGDDKLVGAAGDDTLTCGGGRDKMVGGSGKDVFVLNTGEGFAVIRDFHTGQDMLGLSAGISFNDLAIAYTRGKTSISLQSDNDVLAVLNGKVTLTAANFSAQV
jgi:Putative Ig domain/RTX calcium-binding nonapeptide repeat (4 copies)